MQSNWWFARTESVWPRRNWWLGLLLVLLVSAVLRYPGYDFSLPYIDHVDEPAYNIAARMIIDSGSAKPIGMHGYPPGIVTINYVLLRAFHDPAEPPGSIIWMVRLISVTVSVITILVLGLLAYTISTPLAGILAAWLWAVAPIIVEHSRYATADPYVTFFAILAVYFTLVGTHYDRDRWTSWGVFASIAAVVFKYQAIAIVPVVAMLPLLRLFSLPATERRRVWTNWGYNMLTFALFGFWLVAIYPTTEADKSPDWSAAGARFGIPTLRVLRTNFYRITDPLQPLSIWLGGSIGFAIIAAWGRMRRTVHWIETLAILVAAAMWYGTVSLYGIQFFRQFVSVGAFLTVLAAAGLAALASVLSVVLTRDHDRLSLKASRTPLVVGAGFALVIFALTLSPLLDSVDNVRTHLRPDSRNALAKYADSSLPSGAYISWNENHKTFNAPWGGYPGDTEFPLYDTASIVDRPIAEWQAAGVRYAIISYTAYTQMLNTDIGREILDETAVLKLYPPADKNRGPAMAVIALETIEHPAEGMLGPVELLGYDIDQTTVHPGETITFKFFWRADAALGSDFHVYNHLVPETSRDIIAQVDGLPLPTAKRGTQDWDDPQETIMSHPFELTIPANTAPGTYRLLTGFYDPATWERLTTPDGEDYLLVTTITVTE